MTYLMVAVAAFTLAALLRKPFVLHFAAAGVWWWKKSTNPRKEGLVWVIGLALWGLWQGYDYYLGQEYGSGFLRKLMMPDSGSEVANLFLNSIKKWGWMWLSPAWVAWFLVGGFMLYTYKGNTPGIKDTRLPLFGLVSLLLGVLYAVAMLRQFPDHDYYGIDAFYPAFFIAASALAAATSGYKKMIWVEGLLLAGALGWAVAAANRY